MMDNTKKIIIGATLLITGSVAPVFPADSITVQEWRQVVAQIDAQVKVNPEVEDINAEIIKLLPKESLLEKIIE